MSLSTPAPTVADPPRSICDGVDEKAVFSPTLETIGKIAAMGGVRHIHSTVFKNVAGTMVELPNLQAMGEKS